MTTICNTLSAQVIPDFSRDINFAESKLLEIHPKLRFDVKEQEKVKQAFLRLKTKANKLTVQQFNIELVRIFALLNDGHTMVVLDTNQQWLPFRLYQFADGLYITAIEENKKQFLGARVDRIGNLSWKEAVQIVKPFISADNEWWVKEKAPIFLSSVDLLQFVNITTNKTVELTVEKNGKKEVLSFEARSGDYKHIRWMGWGEMFGPFINLAAFKPEYLSFDFRENKPEIPLHLRLRQPYHFNFIDSTKTLFFQYNFVQRNWDDLTSKHFFDSLFNYADLHKIDIKRFVIDIRYNSGGDGTLLKPFILHLMQRPWLQEYGKLFVITGRKTFSAGIMAYSELIKYSNAIFIGEPGGAGRNHYGDATELELPDTKIRFQISTLFWQTGFPSDTSHFFAPDFPVSYEALTYFSGEDDAMATIDKGLIKLTNLVRSKTNDEVKLAYKNYKQWFQTHEYWWKPFSEDEMNTAGYDLLGIGKIKEAITAFELNSVEYPDSWNAWDSLGEAYYANEEIEKSIFAYEKSLKLNPNNSSAIKMLKKMRD